MLLQKCKFKLIFKLKGNPLREIENKIPDFLVNLIQNPKQFQKKSPKVPFTVEEFQKITDLARNHLNDLPNLMVLSDIFEDVLIVGDTHGFLESTLRIIQSFLNEKVESLLFLGDYVDRGPNSLVNFVLILALMLAWPNRVALLRGNHESIEMNSVYGFKKELLSYYSSIEEYKKIEVMLDLIYEHLSLMAITPKRSIGLHAGIPNGIKSVKELKIIPKPHSYLLFKISNPDMRIKMYKVLEQIQWNDPREHQLTRFLESTRGPNIYFFNDEVVYDFLRNSDAKRIVRAHESSRGGFQCLFNGKLLHIFSSKPYFGKVPRAYTIHEQKNGETILRNLNFNPVREI